MTGKGGSDGGGASKLEEKTALPSQFPNASLLKHSLPHEKEREGERKNRREEKKDREIDSREG